MTVCVDASFPLAFLLRDQHWERAYVVWQQLLRRREQILGPPLITAEITSIVRERMYKRRLTADEASEVLDWAVSLPVAIAPDSSALQRKAFEFATRFNRPKAYDAQYLAVADAIGCELWTADRRLANAVRGKLNWVRYIGDGA